MQAFNRLVFVIFVVAMLSGGTADAGTRADHWSGVDATIGAPYPSYGGVMIGFNLGDEARISAGAGAAGYWLTTAADLKIFLSHNPWAPFIGTGMSYMVGRSTGNFLFWDLDYDSAFVPYIQTGIDFTADVHEELRALHFGFTVAVGIPDSKMVVLPELAIGIYF